MTLIMGILNLTPDSFHEPSRYNYSVLDGPADIVDIGAVSSRPGAPRVSLEEEWARLEPFLKQLRTDKRISIDTTRSEIVRRAHRLIGDFIVNDISASEDDPLMLRTVSELGMEYIAMHKRGNASDMDSLAVYDDVVEDVLEYFRAFGEKAARAGVSRWILDPGFGFAKTEEQNLTLLDNLSRFKEFGRPILVGLADKRFTHGENEKLHRRAILNGADILRVHDPESTVQTVKGLCRSCPADSPGE